MYYSQILLYIEGLIEQKKYIPNYLFQDLTKEDKIKYLEHTYNIIIVDFLLSLNSTERIDIIKLKANTIEESILKNIVINLHQDKEKYELLEIINNHLSDYTKSNIICNMIDDNYKMLAINNFIKDEYYISKITKEMPDEFKELIIDDITKTSYKAEIILSFTNKELTKKYIELPIFSNYRSKLVAATEDKEYILKKFEEIKVTKFRVNLINLIKDEELKLALINLLNNESLKKFILCNTNPTEYKANIEESELLETKINPNITIGIELECSNKEISNFRETPSLFNEYTIKTDNSVNSGFEIVSPILHYTLEDMRTLKSICNLLKENNFYTDQSCGGHIHIGASYFTRKEDFYMLLYLYANTENILYYISDRKNTTKRPSVDRYAMKTKNDYIKAIDYGLFNTSHNEEEITIILNKINSDRYKGLNFKNLGYYYKNTIEFRMPNGEIDFNELILNIKLFSRLIEKSHDLVDNITENVLSLSNTTSEKERLNILMDILFTSEKEKNLYKERYYLNTELERKTQRKLLEELKSKIIKKEEITVSYDEASHSLVKKII